MKRSIGVQINTFDWIYDTSDNVGKYYKLYFECLLLVLTSFCLSKIKKVIKITLNTRNDSPTIYFIGNGVGNMLKQAKLRFARCGINRKKNAKMVLSYLMSFIRN